MTKRSQGIRKSPMWDDNNQTKPNQNKTPKLLIKGEAETIQEMKEMQTNKQKLHISTCPATQIKNAQILSNFTH